MAGVSLWSGILPEFTDFPVAGGPAQSPEGVPKPILLGWGFAVTEIRLERHRAKGALGGTQRQLTAIFVLFCASLFLAGFQSLDFLAMSF